MASGNPFARGTIPNADNAIIDQRKVVDYLLNPAHPDNGGKAMFFSALGFTHTNWPKLAEALIDMLKTAVFFERSISPWGEKFIVDGLLNAPAGQSPVRTIWILDSSHAGPRLVTAYPRKERP